jgi:glycosyltransferase involved in cell wall biosynthesis
MIVKNESKIILRLLETVVDLVDFYCICDTGSTDNTVELIETFFAEHKIPGKITREPFRDFAHNRSFSLKACESIDADYILLLDADMVFQLHISPEEFKQSLTHDYYHLFQGKDTFYYKNTRIVKNRIGASYWGVTHEYVKMPEGSTSSQISKDRAFIHDIGDGGAKTDKFERDIRLLKQGLVDHPNNDRYTFYLANSYKDHGDTDLAIETYKQRSKLGGWIEEVWYSYYNIGRCYKQKGDMANAIYWWLEAYQCYPRRVENLYEIITYYRHIGKNQLAYLFYNMALKQILLHPNPDYLFLQKDVYDYKLNYEFSIFGYYCNVDKYDLTRISMKVLECPHTETSIAKNVLSNYKFYSKRLLSMGAEVTNPVLTTIGRDLIALEPDAVDYVNSTPSIVQIGEDKILVCVRYVTYRINDQGGYENKKYIKTKNALAVINTITWEKEREWLMAYDESIDNLYVGLEDVRLFVHENEVYYNANRGLGPHNIAVEYGKLEPHSGGIVYMEGQQEVEKNWVLFTDAGGKQKVIYGWHKLVIGDLVQDTSSEKEESKKEESEKEESKKEESEKEESEKDGSEKEESKKDGSEKEGSEKEESKKEESEKEEPSGYNFVKTHSISTPPVFKHVRGSTNGVTIGNEVWFICHVVSYEDRRYYYHVFVVLDATTYRVKQYTPLFTFDGTKVEYTLGFVYEPTAATFLIGYSKMDRSTEFLRVSKPVVNSMMILA